MAFWDVWLSTLAEWITHNGWNQRFTSVIFLTFVSVGISLISTVITKLLVDVKTLNEHMALIQEWNKRRGKAMQTADKKLWLSVKRDEARIKRMQTDMMMKRMKPMFITIIPFMLIFLVLRTAFTGHYYAWLPFSIGDFPWIGGASWSAPTDPAHGEPEGYSKLPFIFWYILCSFAFGSIISKVFGVTGSGSPSKPRVKPKKVTINENKTE